MRMSSLCWLVSSSSARGRAVVVVLAENGVAIGYGADGAWTPYSNMQIVNTMAKTSRTTTMPLDKSSLLSSYESDMFFVFSWSNLKSVNPWLKICDLCLSSEFSSCVVEQWLFGGIWNLVLQNNFPTNFLQTGLFYFPPKIGKMGSTKARVLTTIWFLACSKTWNINIH